MEGFKHASVFATLATVLINLFSFPVNGQISTPCSISMINNFTPCLNYITGSSANGTSPTGDCCSAVRSIMGTSMDCTCLLVTASVPLPININRILALSLPRACNTGGIPLQCKASGSPLPAPGPVQFGSSPSPASAFSPQASKSSAFPPALPPATPPATPPVEAKTPSVTPGIRPVLTPSSSSPPSTSSLHALTLVFGGFLMLKLA
ncbi:hypothetical protein Ancab_022324 [Ancistrocladus abbreviatus]